MEKNAFLKKDINFCEKVWIYLMFLAEKREKCKKITFFQKYILQFMEKYVKMSTKSAKL